VFGIVVDGKAVGPVGGINADGCNCIALSGTIVVGPGDDDPMLLGNSAEDPNMDGCIVLGTTPVVLGIRVWDASMEGTDCWILPGASLVAKL